MSRATRGKRVCASKKKSTSEVMSCGVSDFSIIIAVLALLWS